MFATIAAGRKVAADKIAADFGKGRMMSAAKAKDAGMVDRVGTMAELLGSLRTQAGSVRRRFSAVLFD
jgi:ClpP class serine protease